MTLIGSINVPFLSSSLFFYFSSLSALLLDLVFQLHTSWLSLCSVLAAQVWAINRCESQ